MNRFRIVIVDDVAATRDCICRLLSLFPDFQVVGEAENGKQAVQLCDQLNPDVVLMDVNMATMDGFMATVAIRRKLFATQVVLMSVQEEAEYIIQAMAAGAGGYLVKPFTGEELAAVLEPLFRNRQ